MNDLLLQAGFKDSEDPQFPFEYSMAPEDGDEEQESTPALLYDASRNQFCVTDGNIMFVYFNAQTPDEAIAWASQITNFEPNF